MIIGRLHFDGIKPGYHTYFVQYTQYNGASPIRAYNRTYAPRPTKHDNVVDLSGEGEDFLVGYRVSGE